MTTPAAKPRAFFFHYNRPQSQRAGHPMLSVHHAGVCHIVRNVRVLVPTEGRLRRTQPRFVMAGKCREVVIKDGVATIR